MSIAALALQVKVPAWDRLCAAAIDMLMLSAVRLIAAVTTSERVAASREFCLIAMPSKPTLSDNLIGGMPSHRNPRRPASSMAGFNGTWTRSSWTKVPHAGKTSLDDAKEKQLRDALAKATLAEEPVRV